MTHETTGIGACASHVPTAPSHLAYLQLMNNSTPLNRLRSLVMYAVYRSGKDGTQIVQRTADEHRLHADPP